MKQFPLDKTFIIATWLEALIYGFYLCLFSASLYVSVALRRTQNGHTKTMFIIGIFMFIISTMHLGMNCFRMIEGYVVHANDPGGAVAYIGNLAPWDHVFKDALYATQEIFGDAVAIYRCWIIWDRNWGVIMLPTILWLVSVISGYAVCGLYPSIIPGQTVFNSRLTHWITMFYSLAVVQSALTTGFMAYKIWMTDRQSAPFRTQKSNLLPIVRILIESAMLQFLVEVLLLALYVSDYNAQYILLEVVTPLVGITFTAITIRITLQLSSGLANVTPPGYLPPRLGNRSRGTDYPVNTIGSIPMNYIAISITKDIEDHRDGTNKLASSVDTDDRV